MDDEKVCLHDNHVACILIEGEIVSLPSSFSVSIRPCCSEGHEHLAVVTDDSECEEFAGRLEIAAAMGKEVTFLHAKIDSDELERIKKLIEADRPNWHEEVPNAKSWTVYPYRCDCAKQNNGKKVGLFSLMPNVSVTNS